jgi:hypothetical protein
MYVVFRDEDMYPSYHMVLFCIFGRSSQKVQLEHEGNSCDFHHKI